ncbi:MAG TPA: type I-F CRISPR-associated endoribonuclease Cas6/Csy4 [Vicinamibacterales bacterium]|jgi:CRISPR-associated endonuclease Csy4
MDYFTDVEVRRDPELAPHVLLGALYDRLHRALAPDNKLGVAVAFPDYQIRPPSLGRRLRLLGGRTALDTLLASDWLGAMRDHVLVGPVDSIPSHAAHRTLRRVQAKSSPERLRRRLAKRHGLDALQLAERVPENVAERLTLPWVQLRSHTTGQNFRLFLKAGIPQDEPVTGTFNAFGLSLLATIRWF